MPDPEKESTAPSGPVVLVVLDGWGVRQDSEANAISLANTPNWDTLWATYPHSLLQASGEAVGLRPGHMGNSNVGHLNLGAGRVVYQDLLRIDRSLATGHFEQSPAWKSVIGYLGQYPERTLHLLGLLSDGGVHSHQDHLHKLIEHAAGAGVRRLAVHAFLDGRDVPPQSALLYVDRLEAQLERLGVGRVATVMGRFFAMDRDKHWERTSMAYRAMVLGQGLHADSARRAVELAYDRGETDEFVQPTIVTGSGELCLVRPGDAIVAFNFRADRMRQLTRALTEPGFNQFSRDEARVDDLVFVSMTRYQEDFETPYIFAPRTMENTLGQWVSEHGLTQLRIAETEKYAHVTFFFNGGEESELEGEERCLVPSPRVATYDMKPEMSAYEVTDKLILGLEHPGYDLVILNYANTDMVGHTGDLEAAIDAVGHVDKCLGRTIAAVRAHAGEALIVSDHGNAEQMRDPDTGQPHTAHTSNPVPCVLVSQRYRGATLRNGILADVAPTLLQLLGLPRPPQMTSHSLIVRKD